MSPKKRLPKIPRNLLSFTPDPSILVGPQIPAPLHGVNPRTVLGENWWNKERRLAYKSTGYRCAACGVPKWEAKSRQWLEGHERYEIDYLMGRMVYLRAVPLCHYCHNFIHEGRMRSLLDAGRFPYSKYIAIIQHGHRILDAAGLTKKPPYNGPSADWNDWRLVIGDDEYPPKFGSQDEWMKAYGRG